MAGVAGWTALAIAVVVAVALISMLLGLPGGEGTLTGAPWVTLMLGFGLLNIRPARRRRSGWRTWWAR